MVPDDAPTVTSNTSKNVVGNGNPSVRKQPKLKRSSGSATNIARPSGPRKLSNAEYGAAKGQAGFASSTMRRSLSQDFTRDNESSLQRPSKPLQVPVQLPLQLPATKVHLAAVGTRKWLKIEASGATSVLQADKLSITQELGIQIRDLRLLDPAMATSYPSAILCRDKALLVNMEHIKCIITTHYLLLLNADQPSVLQFAEAIQSRLAHGTHGHPAKAKAPPSTKAQKKGSHMRVSKSDSDLETYLLINGSDSSNTSSISHKSYQDTPFELKALEAVLDMVCARLSALTDELWQAGDPVLKSPTAHTVTTLLLDKMRRIKNRMVRLKTRVETIRELLEKFLEDEGDMKSMNLTAREQHLQHISGKPLDPDDKVAYLDQASSLRLALGRLSLERKSHRGVQDDDDADMQQVEMLLEAYFIQMDNTFNRLETMNQYISDTEEYIDLEINNFRNNLIRTRMILNAGNLVMAMVFVVSSIFGMNLSDLHQESYVLFALVSVVSYFGAVVLFMALMGWCIWYKIVNNPFTACFEGRITC
ncbi:TPA: hypothetical protein ACH3X2_001730 [Trebouxia sp. C0005]|nr:MAG: Mg2+ transporter [Trebouxia sp. A1-2]